MSLTIRLENSSSVTTNANKISLFANKVSKNLSLKTNTSPGSDVMFNDVVVTGSSVGLGTVSIYSGTLASFDSTDTKFYSISVTGGLDIRLSSSAQFVELSQKVPVTIQQVQESNYIYCTVSSSRLSTNNIASSSVNFIATPDSSVAITSSYEVGQRFTMSFDKATLSGTLNINGIGEKSIKELEVGASTTTKIDAHIREGQWADLVYDGTDFLILNPLPQFGGRSSSEALTGYMKGIAHSAVAGINDPVRPTAAVTWSAEKGYFIAMSYDGGTFTTYKGATTDLGLGDESYDWVKVSGTGPGFSSIAYSPTLDKFIGVCSNPSNSGAWSSTNGKTWTQVATPIGTITNFYDICWSPELGIFCASGLVGSVATSPDGITWTQRTVSGGAGSTNTLNRICWSSELGLFCTVSYNTSTLNGTIYTSSDGIIWTSRGAYAGTYNVAWSPELMVFVTTGTGTSTSQVSKDGINWTACSGDSTNNGRLLVWCRTLGLFLAVNTSSQLSSYDGNQWRIIDSNITMTGATTTLAGVSTQGIAWSNENGNLVVAPGTILEGQSLLVTQPHGATPPSSNSLTKYFKFNNWKSRTVTTATYNSMTYSPELVLFVAVGSLGQISRSSDGITWSTTTPYVRSWQSVCWSPELGLFCAVSQTAAVDKIATSPDGITWTLRNSTASSPQHTSVCWSADLGLFCATSLTAGHRIITSPDGITWTSQDAGVPAGVVLYFVFWCKEYSRFITGGNNTASFTGVMTSPDGVTWTERSTPGATSSFRWGRMAWSPELNKIIAVATIGGTNPDKNIMSSSDGGITWSLVDHSVDYSRIYVTTWHSIEWSPQLGIFIAEGVGGGGYIFQFMKYFISQDGINWVPSSSGYASVGTISGIIWSPELAKFVTIGNSAGEVYTSE